MQILVVDDCDHNVRHLSTTLTNAGYKVTSATDGLEALQLAKQLKPRLVILDIFMPGLDGIQIGLRLKEDPVTRNIPVIFLTAMTGSSESGEKSFDSGELVGAVRLAIGRAA